MKPADIGDPQTFYPVPPRGRHLFLVKCFHIYWIAVKFGTHIHTPLRMNCSNFGAGLTFVGVIVESKFWLFLTKYLQNILWLTS